ncbi:MAG: hypothetical protein IKT33_02985 [Clostridia bacterium]|jgi:hypothetical protein|nr:hypothetical protein [Clostridia bacterium]
MLNKTEARVMSYIFEKCKGENKGIFTPKELLAALMPKYEITARQLDVVMSNLALDDYIECEKKDKDGKLYFLVSLTMRGAAFDRERQSQKRQMVKSLLWKLGLTVGGAVVAFILGLILNRIAGK